MNKDVKTNKFLILPDYDLVLYKNNEKVYCLTIEEAKKEIDLPQDLHFSQLSEMPPADSSPLTLTSIEPIDRPITPFLI